MPIDVHRSLRSRHLVLRVSAGEVVPDAIATVLRDEQVACGWLRASGVLADVELRAYDPAIGALAAARRIEGPVHVLSLEGGVGQSEGEISISLRALLARETDSGLEVLSGEVGIARTVALEVLVTSLDDLSLERGLDEAAGVWLLQPTERSPDEPRVAKPTARDAPGGWSAAVDASDRVEREPARARAAPGALPATGVPMPVRPPPRRGPDLDTPFPEQGDSVDHFAFGPCDVIKSDGDRLHVKVHKDGRVREIALGMLRVSRLPDAEDGRRRFKLERKM